MAWPPPALPINITDATEQETIHSDLHNKTGQAVNDLVAHVQAQDSANASALLTKLGPTSHPGTYVGGPGPGAPLLVRAGHFGGTTSGYGDVICNFATPFPNGVIAVTLTPYGDLAGNVNVCAWWPFIQSVTLSYVYLFAMAPEGWPGAGGHPPTKVTTWTLASQPVSFDYIAIGV
jgi:hypothetical protein